MYPTRFSTFQDRLEIFGVLFAEAEVVKHVKHKCTTNEQLKETISCYSSRGMVNLSENENISRLMNGSVVEAKV